MGQRMTAPIRRVGLIGYGAIGRVVAAALAEGQIPGMALTCVATKDSAPHAHVPRTTIEQAIQRCDLIVEAAGQQAVRDYGRRILEAGRDLLVVSVGALADAAFAAQLLAPADGRIYFTSGAVGGLDLLAASRDLAPFDTVTLTTTKLPATLVQPWMDQDTRDAVLTATEPIEIYRGTAADVPTRFPKSTNVAAAVALAVGDWDRVTVIVCADPAATRTRHVIEAISPYGQYRFEIGNTPDDANPATSKVVPYAVLRTLRAITGQSGQII